MEVYLSTYVIEYIFKGNLESFVDVNLFFPLDIVLLIT